LAHLRASASGVSPDTIKGPKKDTVVHYVGGMFLELTIEQNTPRRTKCTIKIDAAPERGKLVLPADVLPVEALSASSQDTPG